jgi:hypothetical protein
VKAGQDPPGEEVAEGVEHYVLCLEARVDGVRDASGT